MRTRCHLDVAGRLAVPRRRHAVAVGGSLAGLLAARVLSDHADGAPLLDQDSRHARFRLRSAFPRRWPWCHTHLCRADGKGTGRARKRLEQCAPALSGLARAAGMNRRVDGNVLGVARAGGFDKVQLGLLLRRGAAGGVATAAANGLRR